MKGIVREICLSSIEFPTKEYSSYDELYDNLKKGDKVFIQKDKDAEALLMEVELKEAGKGMIIFKDDVANVITSKEFPCYKVAKIIEAEEKERTVISTPNLIFNLMKEERKMYLSTCRLKNLAIYVFEKLSQNEQLQEYDLHVSSCQEEIERSVLYQNDVLKLDVDGDIIYLRESANIEQLTQKYSVDDVIRELIKEFAKQNINYRSTYL